MRWGATYTFCDIIVNKIMLGSSLLIWVLVPKSWVCCLSLPREISLPYETTGFWIHFPVRVSFSWSLVIWNLPPIILLFRQGIDWLRFYRVTNWDS